jgi:hypothetical protein
MILKTPLSAPPQAKALIDKLLAGGCDRGSQGEARLVKRPVSCDGIQITLQCQACGSSIGSAQSHAAHPAWESYPLFDEKLRRDPWNADGDRLADEASAFLGFETRTGHEVYPIGETWDLLTLLVSDVSIAEAMQQLGATRAWTLMTKHALLGLVCEGGPIEVGTAEIAAIEVHRLKSGYLALIDQERIFAFLMLAVHRVYDLEFGWGSSRPWRKRSSGKEGGA